MHKPADRIRNVALVGHRGSGKTSLHEALLFQSGAINRMGTVVDGTTVSDADPDEKARQMSITAAMATFEWQERKVNLIDTPGDSSFVADETRVARRVDEVDLASLPLEVRDRGGEGHVSSLLVLVPV